jgi:hypothetical protein
MAGEIDLLEDFRALVAALDEARIDYAVVGALALAVHGFPRATTDIDLLVRKEDVERVLKAVERVGYRLPALPIAFRNGIEVQRVTKVVGADHLILDLILVNDLLEEAWRSRTRLSSAEGAVTVISREALVQMKAMAGRPQDLVDLDRLRSDEDDE